MINSLLHIEQKSIAWIFLDPLNSANEEKTIQFGLRMGLSEFFDFMLLLEIPIRHIFLEEFPCCCRIIANIKIISCTCSKWYKPMKYYCVANSPRGDDESCDQYRYTQPFNQISQ